MIEKHGDFYTPTCDGCGTKTREAFDFQDAVNAMRAAGWRLMPPDGAVKDWYHLCPACAGRCDFG